MKNKLDENQIWSMSMLVIPVVLLMNVGKSLTDNGGTEILFSGVFALIGAIIGFSVDYFTKEKSRIVKIVAMLSIIIACSLVIYFTLPKKEALTITILN